MLTVRGRWIRTVVTVVAAVLLLAGSIRGSDDDFPFGPFRMYAGVNDPNGVVVSSYMQAVLPGGKAIRVDERGTGLRRAELEAEEGSFVKDPASLAAIAKAHAELHPDEPPSCATPGDSPCATSASHPSEAVHPSRWRRCSRRTRL